MEYILVSACLLGVKCRHDGESRPCDHLIEKLRGLPLLPLCPEQLGGLPTPRPRQCFQDGDGHALLAGRARMITERDEDVTEAFRRGAEETLRLIRLYPVKVAYLKAKSPSCGFGLVDVEGTWQKGDGVTAAALIQEGIRIIRVD